MKDSVLKPANRREWAFLAAGAGVALLALLLLGERYSVSTAGEGIAFRLDRWTGQIDRCGYKCGI